MYSENSRGLRTQPWGLPVLGEMVLEVPLPIFTTWGRPVERGVQCQAPELTDQPEEDDGVEN